jgi:hypothetical protein
MAALRRIVALVLGIGALAWAGEPDEARKFPSPDGKFALECIESDGGVTGARIVETGSGKGVADLPEDVMASAGEEVTLVWSKDSQSVAANFRAGGRYETMALFRRQRDAFQPLGSPESLLSDEVIKPARERELKAANKPVDTSLRRIWDKWDALRWLDANTVEIHGASTVSYVDNDEPIDIAIALDATVAFDETGKPRVVKAAEVPASD